MADSQRAEYDGLASVVDEACPQGGGNDIRDSQDGGDRPGEGE
jgi:hypothetical protein